LDVVSLVKLSMEEGLRTNQFYVVYQPQFSLRSNRLIGFEALLRWSHPVLGQIPPSDFIPLAERNGFINTLGYWAMDTAIREFMPLAQRGYKLSVNVSVLQFQREDFVDRVVYLLRERGFPLEFFVLELTESAPIQHGASFLAMMRSLKSHGITVYIDDFGMGYSSLDYLNFIPVSALKLDRSFVSRVLWDASSRYLLSDIVALARRHKLQVIAEGVETREQVDFLRTRDCDIIQGYILSKPIVIAEVPLFLRAFCSNSINEF